MYGDRPTPADTDVPGGYPETPASIQAKRLSTISREFSHAANQESSTDAFPWAQRGDVNYTNVDGAGWNARPSDPSPSSSKRTITAPQNQLAPGEVSSDESEKTEVEPRFEPIKSTAEQPKLERRDSEAKTEDDLFRALSRRRSLTSNAESQGENDEIERLMSRMFGQARQQNSEEEKTRHAGVIFRNLTVKGVGLGASLQPTVGDIFLDLPRFLWNLVTKGPKAAAGKPPVRELISNFNGCVRPGEILLVLGRPGSGCTTFLKTFCNQRAGFEDVLGDVTYGGTDAKRMAKDFRGEIIYNPEDDLHYATLTVKHTLTFALRTRTPGKESRMEGESKEDYVREFLRVAAKLLWIEHTMDTKVGNEYIRGVSGGERKRVSIAEALITRASVQGWDNSSKGLDASTAVEYVQSLRALTNMAQVSTAVSLYQAGESLYNLVDKVLLIDNGQCLYYGPSDSAKQYFLDLGFDCPDRWTTADFLTSVTDPHERSVRSGWEDRIPRSAQKFADIFRKSEAYRRNLDDIQDYESHLEEQQLARAENTSEKNEKKNYTISFPQQVIALTKRQALIMLGDKASLIGKWGGIIFQSLIVGSLFYKLPPTAAGAFTRGGVLFFILMFNALMALAEQTAAFESKPILLKHKNFSFYRPSAYALAQTVVDIPLVFIQVFLFDIIIYWMAGLSATPSQFFISLLILWIITMTTYAFFRAISALFKTLDDATKVTGVAIQVIIVYTGYLIPPSSMHPWFSWLRWVNWLQYGFECLMSNEFYNLQLDCVVPFLVPNGVPGVEPQYQSCTLAGSRPGEVIVNGGDYIQASFNYSRGHLWRNFGFLWAFFGFFLAIAMIGMERMKPNAGGAAVTVFKRGQVPKSLQKSIETGGRKGNKGDEEAASSREKATISEEASAAQERRDEEAMQTVAKNETIFTFQNVNYTIPFQGGERKLLHNVQGFVRPGKLTALMGASGAGKTTLLNTLAQRITFGVVTGDFLVDGRPLPKSFQRATGFAEQLDIHEPTATVREALQFSALLRQPKEVSTKEKYAYCETIIELLEMHDIAGATIGMVGEGLNAEQRKRLTIGVELASKPELLMFLDEPTSGLDSGAAFNIIRFLRKLADAGQAILCTIHQPSAVLFENFDELILLKSGGRVAYAGELGKDSQQLIKYFESNGGPKCPPDANPAEWMLEAIGAGNPDYAGQDWGDTWLQSKNFEDQSKEISEMNEKRRNVQHSKNIQDDREYAMPLWTQTTAVVKRSFVAYWRSPNYIMGKMILHIFTGLFNTFTFWRLGDASIDMQSRLFSIFMTLTISPPLIQQLQPVFLNSRNIFQSRENNAKIYSWFAWTTAAVLAEIPYAIVGGAIYFNCWWWGLMGYKMTGFPSGFTFLCVVIFELYYVSFGQAIAAFSPNQLLASLFVPLFFLFVVAFCGVAVPPASLPYFWQKWMYPLTPFHYLLEAFVGIAIHDKPVTCKPTELARFRPPPDMSCESYTENYSAHASGILQSVSNDGLCEYCQYKNGDEFGTQFSVYYSNIWRDFGIVWAYILFNYAVVYFATYLRFRGKNPFSGILAKRKQRKA
ncbi:ABC-2 type transporter-domain-containing protein [Daldinia decipiens]|uniref:ABC-2 type transporter-domain-containing protein n=1 Tax=Daldinia decipiens TaxID=326647 RepID=UPI0020C29B19|nr:ABC-2 type transporter-domain-containing protein [Daldinia decipiens]KAI1655780.1 ABC-2 type transporter-domain-containing protein [Daldinia decipiens]